MDANFFYNLFGMKKKFKTWLWKKHQSKNDENLSNLNKIKHQKKGVERYKIQGLNLNKKKDTTEGKLQREQEQINYSNLLKSQILY
jgi:hypothetical protein